MWRINVFIRAHVPDNDKATLNAYMRGGSGHRRNLYECPWGSQYRDNFGSCVKRYECAWGPKYVESTSRQALLVCGLAQWRSQMLRSSVASTACEQFASGRFDAHALKPVFVTPSLPLRGPPPLRSRSLRFLPAPLHFRYAQRSHALYMLTICAVIKCRTLIP